MASALHHSPFILMPAGCPHGDIFLGSGIMMLEASQQGCQVLHLVISITLFLHTLPPIAIS